MFSRLMFCWTFKKWSLNFSQNQLTIINVAGWTLLWVGGRVLTGSATLENAGGISFRGGGVSVPWFQESPVHNARLRTSLEVIGDFSWLLVIFDVGLFSLLNGVKMSKWELVCFDRRMLYTRFQRIERFQMNPSYQVVVRPISRKTGTSPRLRRLPFHNITVPAPSGALEHV